MKTIKILLWAIICFLLCIITEIFAFDSGFTEAYFISIALLCLGILILVIGLAFLNTSEHYKDNEK